MGFDISGVLKLIGGIKQKVTPQVYSGGTLLIRQSEGASIFGSDSLLNNIAPLQTAYSNGGLTSVFPNNPVATNASTLQTNVSSAIPTVSAITTTTTSGSGSSATTTTSATYPLFTAALKSAQTSLSTYYYWTKLLSGQTAPDYDNNEFGLVDILDVSSSGSASLTDLTAPLNINTTLATAITNLNTLINNVVAKSTADSDAVTQLNAIMLPINNSLSTAQTAYYSSSSTDAQATVIGMALGYVNGTPSPESTFVQSLLDPSLTPLVIAENQAALSAVAENTAQAKIAKIEKDRLHAFMLELEKTLKQSEQIIEKEV